MINIVEQLNYIYNLKYILIKTKEDYNKLNKNIISLFLNNNFININKLPNTFIKLIYFVNNNYLNNLPLNLNILNNNKINCNLPPNIIYLYCDYCDINNLPRSLQFIYIYIFNKTKIAKELVDYNYNKKNINFIYYYEYIIKLKFIKL